MKLIIEKNDYFGRGISHCNKKIAFVNKTLKDEVVEASVTLENKNYDEWKVNKIIKSSKDRKESFCPFGKDCDGCCFDMLSYENYLLYKEKGLKEFFEHHKIIFPDLKLIANQNDLAYRRKLSLKVKNYQLGYYEENTHNFIPINNCLLALKCIQDIMKDFSLFSFSNGELMIKANNNEELLLSIKTSDNLNINKELYKKHKIAGIILNDKVIYNYSYFYLRTCGMLYKVSYNSFFQVNDYISMKISHDVLSFLEPNDIVLDLYCGVGYFTFQMSKIAKKVVGIEIVENAILNALENQKLNHTSNVTFILGRVEDKIDKISLNFSKVLLDPPRAGLDKKTKKFLLNSNIPLLMYVSCNPISLVRDLKELQTKYDIIFLRSYDMFSYTKHVECLCVLKLRKIT